MKFEFTVAEADAGRRLDRFLSAHLAPQLGELPPSRIQRLLRKGDVKVNGKRAKAGDLVHAGDQIVAHHPDPAGAGRAGAARGVRDGRRRTPARDVTLSPAAEPTPPGESSSDQFRKVYEGPGIPVLHEATDIVVVNKPPAVSCDHGEGGGPGLLTWAEERYAEQIAAGEMRPAAGHRLDIGTSGAVCITLTAAASEAFRKGLEDGRVSKRYWVLVWGRPIEQEFVLEIPLKRLPHAPRNRPKVVAAPSAQEGQSARTRFRWIAAGPEASLLEAEPLTGRTHQVRAHCLAHGLPVVGDPRYGDPKRDKAIGLDSWLKRHCLHSRHLALRESESAFSVNAALTGDFERALVTLGVPVDS